MVSSSSQAAGELLAHRRPAAWLLLLTILATWQHRK
jgi:hypothetical protein